MAGILVNNKLNDNSVYYWAVAVMLKCAWRRYKQTGLC